LSSILGRIERGEGKPGDIDTLLDVAGNVAGNTFCPLGDGAASVVQTFIKHFRPEFEEHVRDKKCRFKA
jgi:NADH-quinone oxidoreductase subunit F